MKVNNKQRIIIDDDIIVTSPRNLGDSLKDVIDEQRKDIETLKGNMKFIYAYGGIGGTGSGGSGGGSTTREPKLYVELQNIETGDSKQVNLDINNTNPLILPKPGIYRLYVKLSRSGGERFIFKYAIGKNSINFAPRNELTEANNHTYINENVSLDSNGSIKIYLEDPNEEVVLCNIEQRYIVTPHNFDIAFMYESGGSSIRYDSGNEHFLGDTTKDPFINISYDIILPQASDIVVTYSVGDFVSEEIKCSKSSDKIKIFLKDIEKDGKPFLRNENTGTYKVSVSFRYMSLTEHQGASGEFNFTLIPSYLFINVRPSINILYDTFDELQNEIKEQTIPNRTLNMGAYLSLYSKVYDGKVGSYYENYKIYYTGYDKVDNKWIPVNSGSDSVQEQRESTVGISFNFNTPGIKKLVLTTESNKNGSSCTVEKYIYVKDFEELIDWPTTNFDYYFKANDAQKYSVNNLGEVTFPDNIFGDSLYEQKFTNSPIELSHPSWTNATDLGTDITTVISFGIQLSDVNTEHSLILEAFSYDRSTYKLYTDSLFGQEHSNINKIFIPNEEYNATDGTKYHLVQICRYKDSPETYIDYLYIDGKLESCKHDIEPLPATISKIVLNNVNIAYNLINLQYYPSANLNIDAVIYRYWLAYKQRYVNNALGIDVSEVEKQILTLSESGGFKFDGSNVIVNKSTVETIAASVDIPTIMFDYTLKSTETYEEFMKSVLKGYLSGDTGSFGNKDISLWWCGGRAQTSNPTLHCLGDSKTGRIEVGGLVGNWQISFQGTSTMGNRIKNFSLRIVTSNSGDDLNSILFSPKFNKNDSSTFLPEKEWTLKADIADSAHANNTSVGKFVNKVCTKFNTNLPLSDANAYVKNTLEGFPVLLFFRCNSDDQIYYFGVYNFNLGRTSFNNLGYNTDIDTVFKNSTESTSDDFAYSYSRGIFNNQLAVGEIQANKCMFDFSQSDPTLLFKGTTPGNNPHMFGSDSDIKAADVSIAKGTLGEFVKAVSKAGAYCFSKIGKEFIDPRLSGGGFNNDIYKNINGVTDVRHQVYYDAAGNLQWKTNTEIGDPANLDEDALLELISHNLSDGETHNEPRFDYRSGSEYYTICMAFGLVDSILKNMNIKSWNNRLCYCAFYDMDCGFGEDNAGEESVSYMAATDYWYSTTRNGILKPVEINYDYWDEDNGGKGFDFTSSYLLAVIKYAKPICNYVSELNNTPLENYPQDFWAKLRGVNGELKNAKYFLDNYFKSGVHMIPEYLTSLNYKVKYLYTDEQGVPIANSEAFNGTRYAKVKDWLTKRLHFLDVMFNVQGINKSIKESIVIPSPLQENKNAAVLNPDVVVLRDAFSYEDLDKSLASNTKTVDIYAPKNTPVIIYSDKFSDIYILPEDTNDREHPNKLQITTTMAMRSTIYGSKEFIDVSDIGVFLTSYKRIVSDKLENVIYDNSSIGIQTGGLSIESVSVRNIKLNMPTYSGTLTLKNDNNPLIGSSISSIDISTSGFNGDFSNFPNLTSLNISSVNSRNNINIAGNPLLTSDDLHISGLSNKSLTTLNALVVQDVPGNFSLINTSIKELSITGVLDENGNAVSEFSITGDTALTSLKLKNMKKIKIVNCPNLESLSIWSSEEAGTNGTCESLEIDMSGYLNHKEIVPKLKTIVSTGNETPVDGYFNLNTETFKNLNYLTIRALNNVETIELPDREVKVGTLRNCKNLAVIKTPGTNSRLILTGPSTFENCPKYWMRNDVKENNNGTSYIVPDGYTKMGVDHNCTDLSNTFSLQAAVSGDKFSLYNAKWFIETVIDDYVAARITTLANCFYNRSGIVYNSRSAYQDEEYGSKAPSLSRFIALKDISQMYYGIRIDVLTRYLLSLPGGDKYNVPENTLKWDSFIKRGDLNVSKDCFENVSYRITSLNNLILTIKEPNIDKEEYTNITNTESDRYDILDLFDIRTDSTGKLLPLTNITSISSLNFNAEQYIDFSRLFEVLPNVTRIDNFLNTDLQRFNIEGMLKPCENLLSVVNSFTTSPTNNPVDLWEFFNWEGNKDIELLFSSADDNTPSFNFNKTVSYSNLVNIFKSITKYEKLTKLTNVFSNCTVTGYAELDKPEIKFGDGVVLDNIKSINYLFTNMKSNRPDQGLSFSRNLFVQLPNVEKLRMTFSGVRFTEMFSIDFFARRKSIPQSSEVYILTGSDETLDSSYEKHMLYTYEYNKNIVDLNNTFYNARFVSCNPWYDRGEDNVEIEKNYISTIEGTKLSNVSKYYICDNRDYYTISYGDALTGTIKCTDNIIRVDASVSYSRILGDIYVKKNSNKYEGYVKTGSDYNMVFTNISGFVSIFNNCNIVEDTDYRIFTINRYNKGTYTAYTLSTPEIDDNFNNYTHYVKDIDIDTTDSLSYLKGAWQNHNLMGDYGQFNTNQSEISESTDMSDLEGKTFVFKYNTCDLYPTYCMLPPDMLYGCYSTIDLTGTFSDINAMGVIPRHFTSTCSGKNIPDLFRNTNVLPNVQYYYRDYSTPNPAFNGILNGIPAVRFEDYNILNETGEIEKVEYEKPQEGETYEDIAVVIYRDENDNLRRRSKNNKDKEKGQFVFAPKNFSTSIDIKNTFNFRYNLPPNYVINGEYANEAELMERTINPIDGERGLNFFYVQYFIMMDDSARWPIIIDARNPFMRNVYDVDYTYGEERLYYFEPSSTFENAWTRNSSIQEAGGWYSHVSQTFNSMLNLCGTTDKYTSCANDRGCPLNIDNSVKLDNFIDGNLVTFLNGRVFDKVIDVSQFTTSANKINANSYIINMPNMAKNIILPVFRDNLYDEELRFINGNGNNTNEYNFYRFMFNDETSDGPGSSLYNYMYQFTKIAGEKYLSARPIAPKYKHN